MSSLKQIAQNTSKPKYDVVIPSTGKKTKMSPFLVKDEKILLMAAESQSTKQMISALKQVVGSCVDDVDSNELATFDLEYLFLKLRGVSVGEEQEINVICGECEAPTKFKIDLGTIEVTKPEGHNKNVKISDDLMFVMKYPDLDNLDLDKDMDSMFAVFVESVDTVIYGDEMIKITEAEKSDLRDIIDNMTTKQFETLKQYFDTMPKLTKDIEVTCSSCGHVNKKTLEGLSDFF